MKLRTQIATLALALGATTVAHAHETWLLPSSTVLSKAGYVTVDGAVSNDAFHFVYRPLTIRGDALQISAPDGSTVEAENMMLGKLRSVFDVNLEQEGTYRLALSSSGAFASWEENGERKRWRGSRDELAKEVPTEADALSVREVTNRIETFVTVGSPTDIQPEGVGIELIPVTHPNDLYAEEEATFAFTIDGKPAAGLEVSVMPGASRYRDDLLRQTLTADDKGHITFTWPTPGMWWMNAVINDDKGSLQGGERRLAYTATLEVLPQ